MKIHVIDNEGKKIKEINSELFDEPIREDIIFKVIEAEKYKQPYAPRLYAGMDRSASGNVTHKRHSWGSDRGRGMPRIPKKTMWRRGTQFSWIGAIIPSVRGGRRAHPPKTLIGDKKINKRELKKALASALTYTCSINDIKKKYSTLENKKIEIKFPLVVNDKLLKLKTKDFLIALKKILGELYDVSIQKRTVRAGKGKMRGRKYKRNAGLLFVIGKNEDAKFNCVDVINSNDLTVSDLANSGARITIYSEEAIKELEKILK